MSWNACKKSVLNKPWLKCHKNPLGNLLSRKSFILMKNSPHYKTLSDIAKLFSHYENFPLSFGSPNLSTLCKITNNAVILKLSQSQPDFYTTSRYWMWSKVKTVVEFHVFGNNDNRHNSFVALKNFKSQWTLFWLPMHLNLSQRLKSATTKFSPHYIKKSKFTCPL